MGGLPQVNIMPEKTWTGFGRQRGRSGVMTETKKRSEKWNSEGETERITIYLPEGTSEKNGGKAMWVCYIKLGSDTGQHIRPNTIDRR